MTEEKLRVNFGIDDEHQLDICPHITIDGELISENEMKDLKSEYISELTLHCKVCNKTFIITYPS